MKIENRDTGASVNRARLSLDGRADVEKLRRTLDACLRQATDDAATFVIEIPLPADRPGRT